MSGFHPRELIKEVKIRPGIYNRECLEHPPRDHKRQLWLEVAERLTPDEDWLSYSDVEKEARVDEISNKWKHMKDHFYREIKLQEAGEAHKKRKYIYFDDMEFMRPFVGYRLPPINKRGKKSLDSSVDYSRDFESNDSADIDMESFLKSGDSIEDDSSSKNTSTQLKRNAKSTAKEPGMKTSKVLKKSAVDDTNPTFKIRDGDISFSLSLVPTLRKLSDSRKLSAKIEVLKILHRYVDHIERQNLINRRRVSNRNNTTTNSANNEDEMDEDHLEECEENVNIKRERYDDPLNSIGGGGGGDGDSGNVKTWWT